MANPGSTPPNGLPPEIIENSQRPDIRARQLVRLIRAITVAGTAIGAVEGVAGIAYGEPRAIAIGVAAVAYSGWLLRASRRLETASTAEAFLAADATRRAIEAPGDAGDATRPARAAMRPLRLVSGE